MSAVPNRSARRIRQASARSIFRSSIFSQYLLDTSSVSRKLKRNLENPSGNVLDHRLRRARQVPQQIATLCNDGFASDERRPHFSNRPSTRLVKTLTAVQQRNDETCVEQDRLHRPKFRRCFLFDPRSGTPDSNLPRPMTPALLPPQVARFQNTQPLAYNLRRSPAQFSNQNCEPLPRSIIQPSLNCESSFISHSDDG